MRALAILPVSVVLLCGCGRRELPHKNRSVGELRRMLDSREAREQAQGALGLSLHGPESREAVARLVELLGSPDGLVRQQSALALGKIGPAARDASPALQRALAHDDWALRRQAALALGGIGDAAARPALEKLRRDPNKLVRQAAGEALAKLPPEKRR
jgi:HEAT repeat protein